MQFGVFGTGMVGQTIASKLISLGHSVKMGARQAGNEKALAWVKEAGERASEGTFADAAHYGEILVNATAGAVSLEALQAAGAENMGSKILIDIANPIDMNSGMPPSLAFCNTTSLGEQIQTAFPQVQVVKTLNTLNASVMVNPALVPGTHNLFISGNNAEAKAAVVKLLTEFGWTARSVLDLGDISSARGTEMYLALWLRLWGSLGTGYFNVSVVK